MLILTVVNEHSGELLVEREVAVGEIISIENVDIAGIKEFSIKTTSTAVILDPVVY